MISVISNNLPLDKIAAWLYDLTPDVIGYLLMYFGLRKIGYYSHKFSLANRFCLFPWWLPLRYSA